MSAAEIQRLKGLLRSGELPPDKAEQVASQIRNLGGKVQLGNFGYQGGAKARNESFRNAPQTGAQTPFRRINKASNRAGSLLGEGQRIGKELLPEVFEGGSGLDRTTFNNISPERVDFSKINQFIQPSVNEAEQFRTDTGGRFDELVNMRRSKLEGLNAAENMALKESLFRDIDRQKAGALRNVSRTPNLGAGAAFGQRRAIGRDSRDAGIQANRQLLLDNVGIKNQALSNFEGTVGARQNAMGSATDRVAALRGLQATGQQATDQFNSSNALTADQFNSTGQFASDQFNAGQQKDELGARVGAVSAGTGLIGDERDAISSKKLREDLMKFLEQRDTNLFNQAQSLFG